MGWTNPAGVRLQANRIRYRKKGTSAWTYADASPTSGNQNFAGGATSATVPAYETASHFGDGTTWQVQLRHGKWNEGYGGWGAWSSTAEATTTTFVPPAPSRPVGTRGNTKVSLTWTSGGDGGSAITKWQVQQKAGTGQWSAWSDVCTTSSQANCPSTTSHTVTGLNNNTTYRFKVRAVNTVGNGTASPESNAVTALTVPSAPTISVTSNVLFFGSGDVTLRWNGIDNGGSQITKFEYARKTGAAGNYGAWQTLCNLTTHPTTCKPPLYKNFSNQAGGKTHYFKARAHNAQGAGAESEGQATLGATWPPAPVVTATPGNGQVTLNWTAESGGSSITAMEYKYVTPTSTTCNWSNTTVLGASATSTTVSGLTNGTAYKFCVFAVNAKGDGNIGEAVATPAATVPSAPTISVTAYVQFNSGNVTLRWTGIDNGGSQITKFEYAYKTSAAGDYGAWQTLCNLTTHPTTCKPTLHNTLSNVPGGKTYYFKARAHNAQGAGAESFGQATLGATWPAAPVVTATPGNQQVTLSWPTVDSGGSAITRIEYKYVTPTSTACNWTGTTVLAASATSATVTGLTNDTTYKFCVFAVNAKGDGNIGEAVATPATNICNRTLQVRNAIISKVSGKDTCGAITATDLAGITGILNLDGSLGNSYKISALKAGDFDGLTGLTELRLTRHPALSGLPTGIFNNLTSLTTLRLNKNSSLNNLPSGVFNSLTTLTRLGLEENGLTSLPANIFDNLTNLTRLDLDDNSLSSLSANVFDNLTNLIRLDLNENDLTSLPANIFDSLTNLTALNLHENSLTNLSADVFDDLTKLLGLDLSDNSLTSLPAGVFDTLTVLKTLQLDGNTSLSCLPAVPSTVTTLKPNATTRSTWDACGAGVTLSPTSSDLHVAQGETATYTVGLAAAPNSAANSGNVTVTLASSDTDKATVSPSSLTFTTSNWSTPQNVTVSGVADATATLSTATISHTAANGGYDNVEEVSLNVTISKAKITPKANPPTLNHGVKQISVSWSNPIGISLGANRIRYRKKGTSTWTYADANASLSGDQNFEGQVSSATIPANESFTMEEGTTYEVQLRHGKWNNDYSGWGAWSEMAEATTITTGETPKANTPTLSGGDQQISVSWSNPIGIVLEANSIRYRKKGTSTWTYADTNASLSGNQHFEGQVSSATIPANETFTMEDGTTYEVQLRHGKWNDDYDGWGKWSDTGEATTAAAGALSATLGAGASSGPAMAEGGNANSSDDPWLGGGQQANAAVPASIAEKRPPQVTGVQVEPWHQSLDVSWTELPKDTVTGYRLQWKTTGQSWENAVTREISGATTTRATLSDLTNGTKYTVRVAAVKATVAGPWSLTTTGTPIAATLEASDVETTTAILTIDHYRVNWYYKYTSPSGGTCSATAVEGNTAVSLTGLLPGTSYTFAAYSNSTCSSLLATAAFLTKPGQVSGVQVTALDQGLEVSWQVVTGASHYLVQWKSAAHDNYDPVNRQLIVTDGTTTTLKELDNGVLYTVRVAAVNATGSGAWSKEVAGKPYDGRKFDAVILPEVIKQVSASNMRAVTSRLESATSASDTAAMTNMDEVATAAIEFLQNHEDNINSGEMEWEQALSGRSFSLSPIAADRQAQGDDADGAMVTGQPLSTLVLWGSADFSSYGNKAGGVDLDGDLFSFYVGADIKPRPDLLTGLAVARNSSDLDYTAADETKGTYKVRITSAHPYLNYTASDTTSFWLSAGYGRGTVERREEGEQGTTTDRSDWTSLSGGTRLRLWQSHAEGEAAAFSTSLELKLDGTTAQFMETSVQQARLASALSRTVSTPSIELSTAVELGVRIRSGETVGLEVGSNLGWSNPDNGLSATAGARVLMSGGDQREWGLSGRLNYAPGTEGEGLTMALEPSIGTTANRLNDLWTLGDTDLVLNSDGPSAATALRLQGELGYGFTAWSGLVTPYADFSIAEGGSRTIGTGLRYSRWPSGLELDLRLEQEGSATGTTDHSIGLQGRIEL